MLGLTNAAKMAAVGGGTGSVQIPCRPVSQLITAEGHNGGATLPPGFISGDGRSSAFLTNLILDVRLRSGEKVRFNISCPLTSEPCRVIAGAVVISKPLDLL